MVGSPVRVMLPTAETKNVTVIPRDAIIMRSDSQYIFTIDNENVAHKMDVELGYGQGDQVEVLRGIEAGAKIVIRGGERLRDGQSVVMTETETKTG